MAKITSLKELRQHMEAYAERVRKGESFIVMKRSRPFFRISPVDEGDWETVIDFTRFRKNGMPIDELMARLKKLS